MKFLNFYKYPGIVFSVSVTLFFVSIFYAVTIKPPQSFVSHTLLTIEDGETGGQAAMKLKNDGIIQSRVAFKVFLTLFGGAKGLVAGDYSFSKPQDVMSLAWKLSHGSYGLESIRVTLPEGLTVGEIAEILDKRLYRFDKESFLSLASTSEGYLFPDTYFFLPNAKAEGVFSVMRNKFDEKIESVMPVVRRFDKSLDEVVKMASILEEEARTDETRQIIAGILWKRIDDGMPLQVDAVFAYVSDKNTFELTTEDLRKDHPYNTYTRKGLPPTPISNPGLDSINAAIKPIESTYYYYLSDMDGEMHYAMTHDEHVANKDKYLR